MIEPAIRTGMLAPLFMTKVVSQFFPWRIAPITFRASASSRSKRVTCWPRPASGLPALTYRLERAEAFARAARTRSAGAAPASLDALDALCARYRAFVDALDRVRRERSGEAARAALAGPLAAVEAAAESVRVALRAERRL